MADPIEYIQGAELPHIEITWRDPASDIRDFSSGWTFTVRVGLSQQPNNTPALIEKETGIIGDDVAPNVIIEWEEGEISTLAPGEYRFDVIANATATNQDLIRQGLLHILPAIGPPAP